MLKILKWSALVIVVATIALVIFGYLRMDATNARIADEIRSNPEGELAARTMVVTLADGRQYPVNYLREGNTVYMGIDGRWWRAFLDGGAPITMVIQGTTLTGHATTVLDDPPLKKDVFGRLRANVPNWIPEWADAKLVVITLDVPN
ncbi:MAG: hypothetical protein AAF525_16830 [Pseudomonadota bacterium]